MNEIMNIGGVDCYEKDGTAYISAKKYMGNKLQNQIDNTLTVREGQGLFFNSTDDHTTIITVAVVLFICLIIVLSGYLLIYNIMYISVNKNIRFYGMLKTIGTTSKQIKKIVKIQAQQCQRQNRNHNFLKRKMRVSSVSAFHPLIKFRCINQRQSSENGAEQKRIKIKDQNCLRFIMQFADIDKADHGDRNRNQPEIAPFKIPAFFIKPFNRPKSYQCQKSACPNPDNAVIYAEMSCYLQRSSYRYRTNRTRRIRLRRNGRKHHQK